MNVSTARSVVRSATRDGIDTDLYPDAVVDNAIMSAGRKLALRCRVPLVVATVALTQGSTTFTLPDGVLPRQVLDAYLLDEDGVNVKCALALVDADQVRAALSQTRDEQEIPSLLSFDDNNQAGMVWPVPNEDYTAKLRYHDTFTSWTAGDAGADTTTLNLEPEHLDAICWFGAPALLLGQRKEMATLCQIAKQEFEAAIAQLNRIGRVRGRVITRNPHANRYMDQQEIFNKNNPWVDPA